VIPYKEIPSLGPIHPFGVMVATAVLVGSWVAQKRTVKMGLSEEHTEKSTGGAILVGFITAHLYSAIFYFPERVAENPAYLLKFWDGISSFGGFVGGALYVVYYMRKHKLNFLAYADAIIYGWAVAWIFGRLGCTLAFDHPGSITDFAMGMPYPGDAEIKAGIRHNLGFYEAIWSAVVSVFFWTQRDKQRFTGWFFAMFGLLYTPFRFSLDFLRAVDKRYWGLTAGQYAAIALGVAAVAFMIRQSMVAANNPKAATGQ
jgi:phosphatidylglycerol:prolipoprotein diacylglycerol transferase